MTKITTLLKIALFGVLLTGLIVMQYGWITTVKKDKWEQLKYKVISSVYNAAEHIPLQAPTKNTVAGILQQSLSSKGLAAIPFEYNLRSGKSDFASKGFHQQLTGGENNLTVSYVFQQQPDMLLTVVIPSANSLIWKDMRGMITMSVLLVLMIITVFLLSAIWGRWGLQLFYSRRDKIIRNMMQQMESPLTTVSVAAEALRNAAVMRDATKIRFYQQVINEENRRMNEEVKRVLRELE